MNQVFSADHVSLAQLVFNDLIAGDWFTLSVNLGETTLVHQLAHRLQIGITPSDVRLADTHHVDRSLVQTDEDAVVDLQQTEQLQDLAYFGGNFVDTKIKILVLYFYC